jgi:hypothetical protein
MDDIKLTIVAKPEDETTAVHLKSKTHPFFLGDGELRYLCGHCANPLAVGVKRTEPIKWVMRCGRCRQYNQLDPQPMAT